MSGEKNAKTAEAMVLNVYQRLSKVRVDLHACPLQKTGHNTFAGYKYFELGDFLPTANNLFDFYGLLPVVDFSDPARATLTIVNMDAPTETIVFTSPIADANLKGCHPVQVIGAQQTYVRRYLYTMALEIVEHDALDAANGKMEVEKIVEHDDAANGKMEAGKEVSKFRHDMKIIEQFAGATTMDEVAAVWSSINVGLRKEYVQFKDAAKEKINAAVGQ